LVVSAAKCRATSVPPCCPNHSRALRALVIVSSVVKVLEAIRNNVLSGRRPASTDCSSCPSMLETKWKRWPGSSGGRGMCSAVTAIWGPRSEPPMPMFTTSVIDLSLRTCSA